MATGPQTGGTSKAVARFRTSLESFCAAVAALVAPGSCRICDLPSLEAKQHGVCAECLRQVRIPTYPCCARCGEALGMESLRLPMLVRSRNDAATVDAAAGSETGSKCEACEAEDPGFARATAFGEYAGVLRTLIHLHKFHGMEALAKPLGDQMAQAIAGIRKEAPQAMSVIAVPLYRGRRSFNQSRLLAQTAVKLLRKQYPEWKLTERHGTLRRVRKTERQSMLTPRQRAENVRGAFAVEGKLRGEDVLLIDDVYTTGATAKECARVLRNAGATSVWVVTLARTQREIAAMWPAPEAAVLKTGTQTRHANEVR